MLVILVLSASIWSSQDGIIKPQSNDKTGSPANGHPGRSGLTQNNFPWYKGHSRNLR